MKKGGPEDLKRTSRVKAINFPVSGDGTYSRGSLKVETLGKLVTGS